MRWILCRSKSAAVLSDAAETGSVEPSAGLEAGGRWQGTGDRREQAGYWMALSRVGQSQATLNSEVVTAAAVVREKRLTGRSQE